MPSARSHVALLRAINVGGRNGLPMKDLARLCEDAGCRDVVTYIQSGNVAFGATASHAKKLPASLARAILGHAKIDVPVIVRDAAALRAIAKANPFLKKGIDEDELHVGFLADTPTAAQIASLDPKRSPPDEFVVVGSEVFFRFPKGVGKTKLTVGYFDTKLGTTITLRNWRTLQKLIELVA
ncbi:MAG TPA: DUF1697 domain-containing protein [Polyangia bacterium]|nr:DUF1697 domain-containing protein [Polyangia bacterium]